MTENTETSVVEELTNASVMISKLKEALYPKDKNMKKVFGDEVPTRQHFIMTKAKVKALTIKATSLEKSKKEKNYKEGGLSRMIIVKPDLAKFLDLESKELGNVYSQILLTKWFTNYFYTNGIITGRIVVPDKALITLFREELLREGVIDKDGTILEREDNKKGKSKKFKGFDFIHLQKLLPAHINTNKEGLQKIVPEEGNEEKIKILTQEKINLDKIKDVRKSIKLLNKELANKQKMLTKAAQFGDEEEYQIEVKEINKKLKIKTKELLTECKKYKFPCKLE